MSASSPVMSMTGFASIQATLPGGRVFGMTLKGVNHRHLDLQFRLPSGADALEPAIRAAIKAAVRRGHIDVTLSLEKAASNAAAELDEGLLNAYVDAFHRASKLFNVEQQPDINGLLRMPGVMSAAIAPFDLNELYAPAVEALVRVLDQFNQARAAEGSALTADLRALMSTLSSLTQEARTLREGVSAAEFTRLKLKLRELVDTTEVSEERLIAEAAVIANRGDVEEELVRLRTHIDRFCELLDGGGEVGRQLDFLLQEMNREANTLLSKTGGSSGGLRLTDVGLEIKVALERAREQVQNLE